MAAPWVPWGDAQYWPEHRVVSEGVPQGDYAQLVNPTRLLRATSRAGEWPPDGRYERAAERTIEEGIPEIVKTLGGRDQAAPPEGLEEVHVS